MPTRLFCKAFRHWYLRFPKFTANIFFMPTISQQLVAKLLAASNLLQDALAELESPQVEITDEVRAKVQKLLSEGKCLNGGHDIPEGMDVVRGMCRDCYNSANNAKNNGELSEADLVARGLWTAEKSKGGRKRKLREGPLRDLLELTPEQFNATATEKAAAASAKAAEIAKRKGRK